MPGKSKRQYVSALRSEAASATKERVLNAAKALFSQRGIDSVTIAEIAKRADVAASTVYALFRSKEGLLRAIMNLSLFGERFQRAHAQFQGVTDAVELIVRTASVSRAIYEAEHTDLALIRGSSAFSPALRKLEQEFGRRRYAVQEARVRALFDQSRQAKGLDFEEARRLMWMFTSREVYRLLVQEAGWSPERYQRWLERTLVQALVDRPRTPAPDGHDVRASAPQVRRATPQRAPSAREDVA